MISSFSLAHLVVLILAIVYLTTVIWAIITTVRDSTTSTADKFAWVAAIVIVPVLGLIVWAAIRAITRRNPRTP